MTTSSQAAQAIRKELKTAFPLIKFSVRSDNYAGGNSVDVRYDNGVPSKVVDEIVKKYQYGYFDGMTDSYTTQNVNETIPQVQYVMVQRNVTDDIFSKVKLEIAKKFGIVDLLNEQEWRRVFHDWSYAVVNREVRDLAL